MLTGMAFGLLTFHRRPRGRIKLLQPGCCKVKVSEMEILSHRGQRSRSLCSFIGQKGTHSTIYDLFLLNEVKWSEKITKLLTKI